MSVRSLAARPRSFGRDDAPSAWLDKRIGGEERIAAKVLDFIIRQVRGVPLVNDHSHLGRINFFIQQEGDRNISVASPCANPVGPDLELLERLEGNLDEVARSMVLKPCPKFRNATDRVIVPIGVDQHVCVEEVQQAGFFMTSAPFGVATPARGVAPPAWVLRQGFCRPWSLSARPPRAFAERA